MAVEVSVETYRLTEGFPKEEMYGLTSQMRRAAVSIASNIAEGKLRGYEKEFRKFLHIAYGSGAELETQIVIAKRLSKTAELDYARLDERLTSVMKMLNRLIDSVGQSPEPNAQQPL